MYTQNTSNIQNNLEKAKWNWRNQASWLQTILQTKSHENSILLAKKKQKKTKKKPPEI